MSTLKLALAAFILSLGAFITGIPLDQFVYSASSGVIITLLYLGK